MDTREVAETQAVLLAAARSLVAENPAFSLRRLLDKTGVSRADFRCCFASKEDLLAALTGETVKDLNGILEAAQPAAEPVCATIGVENRISAIPSVQPLIQPMEEPLRFVVNGDALSLATVQPSPAVAASEAAPAAPSALPQTDAWLERRLRVFERALAAMEKRQEKSEYSLGHQFALIEEKLGSLTRQAAPAVPVPQPIAEPEQQVPAAKPSAQRAPAAAPQVIIRAPQSIVPAPQPVFGQPASDQPVIESAAPASESDTPLATPTEEGESENAAVAQGEPLTGKPEESGEAQKPISEEEMESFLAHARRVAQNAAQAQAVTMRRRKKRSSPLLAWSCVVMTFLCLLCGGLLFASGAFGHGAAPGMAGTGVIHRQVAQSGFDRLIALADSGNADAQTVLALDYLRGQGVKDDEAAARRWSLAAASQGQPMAEYVLGTLDLESKDAASQGDAMHWFKAAAAQGNVKAMHDLAIAYAEGQGVTKDPVMAVNWFMRAANAGYRDSEFDLAVLYERGLGVPQSAVSALKWYLVAASEGDTPSAARAAFLRTQMDVVEVKAAIAEAASFAPQAPAAFANQPPVL